MSDRERQRSPRDAVAAELETRRVLLVCGLGGVGKTTTAAALGVAAALRGRRTVVLTIDPAPRLADALGLDRAHERPTPVHLEAPGELYGLVLDPKRVFDRALARAAGDSRARERILDNRIYRGLSGAVPGSEEFSAMECLWELYESGEWDLIVLDTPPSAHALDFLEAPSVLAAMLGSRTLRLVAGGGRIGGALAGRSTSAVLKAFGRATGVEVLREVSEFFQALADATGELVRRAAAVRELLASEEAAAALVTAPTGRAIADSVAFAQRVRRFGVRVSFVVANRVTEPPPDLPPAWREGAATQARPGERVHAASAVVAELARAGIDSQLAEAVARSVASQLAVASVERKRLATLQAELPGMPLVVVPRRDRDIRTVEDLVALAPLLADRPEISEQPD